MTIEEFVKARLDEREQLAKAAGPRGGIWRVDCNRECSGPADCRRLYDCKLIEGAADDEITIFDEGGHSGSQAWHIATHDPAAVLRDIAAKRALMAELPPFETLGRDYQGASPGDARHLELAEAAWRSLAAPYADHLDYQDWKAWR